MTLATSNVSEFNNDPKFHQDLEVQFIAENKSAFYFGSRFESDLRKGSKVRLNHELQPFVNDRTGHDNNSYGSAKAYQEEFEVTQGRSVDERVFDIDEMRSEYDIRGQIVKNGMRRIHQNVDRYNFQKLKELAFNVRASVDLTGAADDEARGDLVYAEFQGAGKVLNASGFDMAGRQVAMAPEIYEFLTQGTKVNLSTEQADRRIMSGMYESLSGFVIDKTINLYKDGTAFDVAAKGAIAIGDQTFTVDGVSINAPEIGDTFVNNSKTFTILSVNEVTAATEYDVKVDRPLETAIADNATIEITGYHTVYVPFTKGTVGESVMQQNPQFEELRDTANNATLVRSAVVAFDAFVPEEPARRLVVTPFVYRTIS